MSCYTQILNTAYVAKSCKKIALLIALQREILWKAFYNHGLVLPEGALRPSFSFYIKRL
ncbi:MAG: hypothetical protein ACJAQ6_001058 [Arenicella sp.]|jgi:hypothetical protein